MGENLKAMEAMDTLWTVTADVVELNFDNYAKQCHVLALGTTSYAMREASGEAVLLGVLAARRYPKTFDALLKLCAEDDALTAKIDNLDEAADCLLMGHVSALAAQVVALLS